MTAPVLLFPDSHCIETQISGLCVVNTTPLQRMLAWLHVYAGLSIFSALVITNNVDVEDAKTLRAGP